MVPTQFHPRFLVSRRQRRFAALQSLEPRIFLSSTYATITDLGTLPGGTTSFAEGINDLGQVVGYSDTTGGEDHAFVYNNGAMTDLSTLPGDVTSFAFAINDNSQIVGDSSDSSGVGSDMVQAFLYGGGTMTGLGTLGPDNGISGGTFSDAYGINSLGQAVGDSAADADEDVHAALFINGTVEDLGTFGVADSSSYAQGINNAGNAVGYAENANGDDHAFIDTGDILQDLGTLGGNQSYAFAINNANEIVGYSDDSTGALTAFLYINGAFTNLGAGFLGQIAQGGVADVRAAYGDYGIALNDANEVVGGNYLYDDGTTIDLNSLISPSSGWDIEEATAINNDNQIAGYGLINGQTHAFLLTIQNTSAPSITSSASTTFTAGVANAFTISATGGPAPSFKLTGALPSGVTLTDTGNGSADLTGTPASGSGGTYVFTVAARNGISPKSKQNFTLNVVQPPSITSAATTTFTAGEAGKFVIQTAAFPIPAITEIGALPSGIKFVDRGNGKAALKGTPSVAGDYSFTIKAKNGLNPKGKQSFNLIVASPFAADVNMAVNNLDAADEPAPMADAILLGDSEKGLLNPNR